MDTFDITLFATSVSNDDPISITSPTDRVVKGYKHKLSNVILESDGYHYVIPATSAKGKLRSIAAQIYLKRIRFHHRDRLVADGCKADEAEARAIVAALPTVRELQHLVFGGVLNKGPSVKVSPAFVEHFRRRRPISGVFGCMEPFALFGSVFICNIVALKVIEPLPYTQHPNNTNLNPENLPHLAIVRRDMFATGAFASTDVSDPETIMADRIYEHERTARRKKLDEALKVAPDSAAKKKLNEDSEKEEKRLREENPDRKDVAVGQGRDDGPMFIPTGTMFRHEITFSGSTMLEIGLFLASLRHQVLYKPQIGGRKSNGCGGGLNFEYRSELVEPDGTIVNDGTVIAFSSTTNEDGQRGRGMFSVSPGSFLEQCLKAWDECDIGQFDTSADFRALLANEIQTSDEEIEMPEIPEPGDTMNRPYSVTKTKKEHRA